VWSYEVGSKNRLFENRVSLNSALFQIDWTDRQQSIGLTGCGLSTIVNVGAARSRGFEIDGQFGVTENLTLSGAVSYNKAVYSESVFGVANAAGVRPIIAREGVSLGARPWLFVASVDYDFVAFSLPARVRLDFQHVAKEPITSGRDPQTASYNRVNIGMPANSSLDMSTGITLEDSNVDISFYVKNVLDSRTMLGTRRGGTAGTNSIYNIVERPRTVGFTATYRN